jgi:hypothetical protein
MWECIALSKPQQKSLWCAVPLVNKIDAFSHSLGRLEPVMMMFFLRFERLVIARKLLFNLAN